MNITTWFGTEENPYNSDAWDGYMANKNRTLKTLADNNIGNNIMMAGDSHLKYASSPSFSLQPFTLPPSPSPSKDKDKANPSKSWVSDLVWLDTENYNASTGSGSLGAEFAGTAVSSNSPFGASSTIAEANNQSTLLVRDNAELQWQEGYYRGYYELRISGEEVNASYFGLPDLRSRNGLEISLANFTVKDGEGRLQRPVGGGRVESGALKGEGAEVVGGNLTRDTRSGEWFVGRWNFTGVTLAGSD